jgi:hypothetical protein
VFVATFWQWRSSGMGDAVLDATYVQRKLADKGIEGPDREDQMERLRVMCETYTQLMQKHRKKTKSESADDERDATDDEAEP